MPRRKVPLKAGEYYHVYNRGVNYDKIFFSRENYLFFLRRLRQYGLDEKSETDTSQTSEVSETSEVLGRSGVFDGSEVSEIIAYCLMPNHYHLLVRPAHDNLSHSMQLFGISYTKAINKQQGRVGPLFQGQFQAAHIPTDDYLLHVSRYVHLNPVEARLVKCAEDWEFSSYRDYLGLRQGTLPSPDVVLSQFDSIDAYRQFVESYSAKDKEYIAAFTLD
jgi:hypothetical protein